MTDFAAVLKSIHRPGLLVRAARHGLADWRRERDLRRLLPGMTLPPIGAATMRVLLDEEETMEAARLEGSGRYSVARHVELLVALMAEVQLAAPPHPAADAPPARGPALAPARGAPSGAGGGGGAGGGVGGAQNPAQRLELFGVRGDHAA